MIALPVESLAPWRPARLTGLDLPMVLAALALVSIGVVMIASASMGCAAKNCSAFYFLQRHLAYLALSGCAALVIVRVPLRFWYDHSSTLLLATLGLLVVVLIPGIGREINGSRRWLGLGSLSLQVSEIAKLALVVFIAAYLHRHQRRLREQWRGFMLPMAVLGAVVGLLLLEPDFGASVVICGTVLGMLFLAGVRLWQFGLLLLGGGAALALVAVTSPYKMERLRTYLDPWADQYNSGYQLTQSLIAFGRGEWFGVGLGNSVQKLFYLPEAHTDFIFAIFAEEFGFIGVVAMLALFGLLVARTVAIARRAADRQNWFGAYAAFGVGLSIAGQAFINIGVASGLLPTKGLTLPLLSYGGSSLVACGAMLALVLRIGIETTPPATPREKVSDDRAGD